MGKEAEKAGGISAGDGKAPRECTRSESTANTREASGRAGDGRAGDGRAGNETKEAELLELVNVKSPEDKKREERNAKRRERYAAKKAAAPKKVTSGRAKKDADPTQCQAVIMSLSQVAASREGCAHWQLTPDECASLAQPIANMLRDSEAFAGVNEHADAVALAMAAFTIFMPRFVISAAIRKERKKDAAKGNGQVKPDGRRNQKGQSDRGNGNHAGGNAADGVNDAQDQSSFGAALCG